MSQKALIVFGGWDGHHPAKVAEIFRDILVAERFAVEMSDTLGVFADESKLRQLDLIVPVWTMGKISPAQSCGVLSAVESGVGIAGCHGGMCDAFRECPDWQFMTGGQWVAHPGDCGVEYNVHFTGIYSPITENIADFRVKTEQYYMLVDPAVKVLATTRFPTADGPHVANGPVDMPVVWTKFFRHGRVFYNSLGHDSDVVSHPTVLELMRRGFLWAAEGKALAVRGADGE
jgi:type 1 glutamine amidotransferase